MLKFDVLKGERCCHNFHSSCVLLLLYLSKLPHKNLFGA